MPIYVPGKVTLRQTYIGTDDTDAAAYIAAVEAADEIASPGVGGLETATKVAIHSFVKGCKADGIWPAIKASCILAGARTLAGALVPLVGTAPANNSFVDADYNRETGLKGDGSTKYLNSNRNNDEDPPNNSHTSIFVSEQNPALTQFFVGVDPEIAIVSQNVNMKRHGARVTIGSPATGFIGSSRNNPSQFTSRLNGATGTHSVATSSISGAPIYLFAGGPFLINSTARLSFYSIGESLDLALLDARVTDLINAIGVAIP
jgi:hypothetical protein